MKYKRLTDRDGATRVMSQWAGTSNEPKIYRRLAELEDKIEAGTLVELPCKVGDNAVAIVDTLLYPNAILDVKLKDLAYIVKDENGDITFQHISRIFGTKAEAEKKLKEIKMNNKETDAWREIELTCKGCSAWSGTDCTRNPYTDGCLKENKAD